MRNPGLLSEKTGMCARGHVLSSPHVLPPAHVLSSPHVHAAVVRDGILSPEYGVWNGNGAVHGIRAKSTPSHDETYSQEGENISA